MAKKKKVKVRLLVGFGGEVGGVRSPGAGTVLEVPADLADSLCGEPSGNPRAVRVEEDTPKRTKAGREKAVVKGYETADDS